MRRRALLLATAGLACAGARARGPAALADVAWMVGRWVDPDGGGEVWTRVDAALLGVGWLRGSDGAWSHEVMRIDGSTRLRFVAWPSGQARAVFDEVERDASHVVFADPTHDFPRVIRYARRPGGLVARVEGDRPADGQDFHYVGAPPTAAPALEAADRGAATLGQVGARTLVASGLGPDGSLGFTLGRVTSGGEYVALWRRGADGWQVELAVHGRSPA